MKKVTRLPAQISVSVVKQSLVKELFKKNCKQVVFTLVHHTPPCRRPEELLECCEQIVEAAIPFVSKNKPLVFQRYVDLLRFQIAGQIGAAIGRPNMPAEFFLTEFVS